MPLINFHTFSKHSWNQHCTSEKKSDSHMAHAEIWFLHDPAHVEIWFLHDPWRIHVQLLWFDEFFIVFLQTLVKKNARALENLSNDNKRQKIAWLTPTGIRFPIDAYRISLNIVRGHYSVVFIKRTGSLNYFEVFYHLEHFFHALNENFLPPWSFFHALNEIFAPPCSLIISCLLNIDTTE